MRNEDMSEVNRIRHNSDCRQRLGIYYDALERDCIKYEERRDEGIGQIVDAPVHIPQAIAHSDGCNDAAR
ncbi:hypothetical protein D3C78_1862350 [compost metagenome]